MQTGKLVEISLKAAEILLTSGAEIYRVEDTINRICQYYNAQSESVVTATGIFISVRQPGDDGAVTVVRRIRQRTVDLYRIELVNNFSRSLGETLLEYDAAMEYLEEIERTSRYKYPIRLVAAGIAPFVFTVLFGGGVGEGIVSIFIGLLIYFLTGLISKAGFYPFFELFAAGIAAGICSSISVWLFPDYNRYKIIIGSLMMFLPGVAMTNSIKDALYGDWVASISRMGEAIFIAAALGAGVGFALVIGISWIRVGG